MRDDVAARTQSLTWKKAFFSTTGAIAGAAAGLGTALAIPALLPTLPALVIGGGALGLTAGASVADLLTVKDQTALDIDRKTLLGERSKKLGWRGFKEEVLVDLPYHGLTSAQVATMALAQQKP